jgi:hypothetical protein
MDQSTSKLSETLQNLFSTQLDADGWKPMKSMNHAYMASLKIYKAKQSSDEDF